MEVANPSCPATKSNLPRAKRQAREDIFNDEDDNPFCRKVSSKDIHDGEPMHLDSISYSTPTKRGLSGKKVKSSSVKLRGDFDIIGHSNG